MSKRTLLPLATVAALAGLLLAAGTATGSRAIELSTSEGSLEGVTADARALTFRTEEGTVVITCEVHRRINFVRSIEKSVGEPVGDVSGATVRACAGGRVMLLDLSWRITYVGFTGVLPAITSVLVRISNVGVLVEPSSWLGLVRCLYRGAIEGSLTGATLTLREVPRLPLYRTLGGLACPDELIVEGTLALRPTLRFRLL